MLDASLSTPPCPAKHDDLASSSNRGKHQIEANARERRAEAELEDNLEVLLQGVSRLRALALATGTGIEASTADVQTLVVKTGGCLDRSDSV